MSTVHAKKRAVTFRLDAPEAVSVALVGDFNGWDPSANPLRRRKDGMWWVTVRLSPGVYQYKLVVNGSEWREDPRNPHRVPNEYGTWNSVLEVV